MFPPIQPTGLSYFSWKRNGNLPSGLKHLFYTSWEDALWDVLHHKVRKGETILVPVFFCMDVVANIQSHGYSVSYYKTGSDLQTNLSDFILSIEKYNPSVIIIFHPVGITNTLIQHYAQWKRCVNEKTIIIEDCVHRITDPNKIKLLTPRHIRIDSLRKVSPVQGSNVYGNSNFLNFSESSIRHSLPYHLTVNLLFILYQILLLLRLNIFAEYIMLKTYDIIGDSKVASRGNALFKILSSHIDIHRIKNIKQKQVELYEKYLKKYSVPFADDDAKELRGYPIRVPFEHKYSFVLRLRKAGLITRLELEGSPWSYRFGIIYLPLGPHMNETQQRNIINLCKSHFTFIN